MKLIPTIFLSYAWANRDVADQIDKDFKVAGITFLRDVRDAEYRTSIKDFMKRVGDSDYVL
ncbi:MAG: toll/interleukin-1 receptor domain-containing protein, partial [Fimbriimonadaceae bacterium]|nr:toll/interleukin-1 receptor domain-containing protein [Chitinophagales bacterium]